MVLSHLKKIFWDIPVSIPKSLYKTNGFLGYVGSLILIAGFFALVTSFIYDWNTEYLNPCVEIDYETRCSGSGDAYECFEEIICVKRESDQTTTTKTKLWFEAKNTLYIFCGAYFLIPFIGYLLWVLNTGWFERRVPKFYRYFIKRWNKIMIFFMYLNFSLAIIKGLISYF